VWTNATGRERYFLDDHDRTTWIRTLVRVLGLNDWTCVAFCQMSTHMHAIVAVPDESLPLGMKQLNLGYSRYFNDRHDRVGQFVRRRYGSRRIEDGRDLVGTYAYVVLNPVLAGISARAEDWRWSSYATALGISADFAFTDASLVVAETGGAPDALRRTIEARAGELLSRQATSGV
jgi:REP element-mobilizing transposase RayT